MSAAVPGHSGPGSNRANPVGRGSGDAGRDRAGSSTGGGASVVEVVVVVRRVVGVMVVEVVVDVVLDVGATVVVVTGVGRGGTVDVGGAAASPPAQAASRHPATVTVNARIARIGSRR